MASYLPLVQRIQPVGSSHLACHRRATRIWAALRVASLYQRCLFKWEKFSLIMAGRSAFSYLASKISTTRLVALRVLIGFWARQVLCLSALVGVGYMAWKWIFISLKSWMVSWWFLVQTQNCTSPCLKSYGPCLIYFGTKRTHSCILGLKGEALFLELSSFFCCVYRS